MIEWHDENHGKVFGVPMRCVRSDYANAKTTDDEIVVLKWQSFFDDYRNILTPPKTVFEVGIFEGGSIFVLAAMWPDTKFVGVDLREENPAVLRHVERLGLQDRVELHYRVSQNDREKLTPIIEKNPPDVIIDDASHYYGFSKDTFNITFPYLKPGGSYILEDWGWAHFRAWEKFTAYENRPALSNLVYEIIMASATTPQVVESALVNGRMMIVRKNANCAALDSSFDLNKIYTARGKNLETLI